MPSLDVSDAFDPDFMDTLHRRRRVQTVGDNGLAVDRDMRSRFLGVVCNDTGDTLQRGSDAARVSGSINVTARFDLRMDGPDFDADIVEWDCRSYTVVNVKDYGRYGRGFVIVTCQVINPAG